MGLDLHVMPLWRAFAGEFESPLEQLLGDGVRRIGAPKGDAPADKARAMVEAVRLDLSGRGGAELSWSDEGPVVESVQMPFDGLHALRAFAAFQDHPNGREYVGHDPPHEHLSLSPAYRKGGTRFPHLLYHADNAGYYLPCDFAEPIVNKPPKGRFLAWTERLSTRLSLGLTVMWLKTKAALGQDNIIDRFKLKIIRDATRKAQESRKDPHQGDYVDADCTGSSPGLLRELQVLGSLLGMTRDWGELASGEAAAEEDDPLVLPKVGWSILHLVTRKSVEHGLPIVFDG